MSASPRWLRNQILANARALFPGENDATLDIMTGRSVLGPEYSMLNAESTLVM
ncbi:hypothetical protein DPSP01_010283 [Paraphaeosphaeria sporulosa]